MKELLDSLAADFDIAEGSINIVTADWFADDLRLDLAIKFDDDRTELWEVSCTGVIEEAISSDGSDSLVLSTNSALLKPFTEHAVQVMFSQNAMAPETLFGIICSCCIEVTGRPESIPRYLNGAASRSGICSSAYGLLGEFPASLAESVLAALEGKPIQAHALSGFLPTRWNGLQHVPYANLSVLEVGNSYVIAEQFSACRG